MTIGIEIGEMTDVGGTLPADAVVPVVSGGRNYRFSLATALGLLTTISSLAASAGSALVGFLQAGTGAVTRTSQAKLCERVSPFDFGAVGDGTTDDTAAFLAAVAALRSGGTLWLGDGYTFKIAQTLVFTKPINIRGGSKEQSKLLFSSAGTYLAAPYKAGLVFLHSSSTVPSYSGDARRSVLSGFTVAMQAGPAAMTGIISLCPVYCYEVDANNFSAVGFKDIATSGGVAGNANGSSFTNCQAYQNGSHGFDLDGNDANACTLIGCRSDSNTGWGFYDTSLLGNSYLGCEAATNTAGGYTSTVATARSTYTGCYAETGQTWVVGALCLIINPQGDLSGITGSVIQQIPTGEVYSKKALTFAANADIANAGGDGAFPGAFMRISSAGIDFNPDSDGPHIKLGNVLNPADYTDWLNGADPVLRFPARDNISGNVKKKRAHMPEGFTVGGTGASGIVGSCNGAGALPAFGTYAKGAIILNENVTSGQPMGWGNTGAAWSAMPNWA